MENDNQYQQDLDWYAEVYAAVAERVDDKTVAIALTQEMAKDRRSRKRAQEGGGNGTQEASEKQIRYLKKLGVDVEPGISKAEASRMIDEALGKSEQEGGLLGRPLRMGVARWT